MIKNNNAIKVEISFFWRIITQHMNKYIERVELGYLLDALTLDLNSLAECCVA